MPTALTMNTRLDHAKSLLERLADKAADAKTRSEIANVATAIGVAEDRISSLEFVVNGLAKKAELSRRSRSRRSLTLTAIYRSASPCSSGSLRCRGRRSAEVGSRFRSTTLQWAKRGIATDAAGRCRNGRAAALSATASCFS